jgi:hypothetical protein
MSGNLPKSLDSQQDTQPTSELRNNLNNANLTSDTQMKEDSSSSNPIQTGTLSPIPKRKRRLTVQEAATQKFIELEEKQMKLFYKEKEKDIEKAEDYHFFMSLIPHMSQFNSLQKLKVRNKVKVITDMAFSLGSMSHEMSQSGFSSSTKICHHKMFVTVAPNDHKRSTCRIIVHHSRKEMFTINSKTRLITTHCCNHSQQ